MAINCSERGDKHAYTNTSGSTINSGSVVFISTVAFIAQSDIPSGETGSVKINGVWSLPKLSTDSFTDMQDVYWDSTNSYVTVTATNNTLIGKAFGDSPANTSSSANVLLNGLPS